MKAIVRNIETDTYAETAEISDIFVMDWLIGEVIDVEPSDCCPGWYDYFDPEAEEDDESNPWRFYQDWLTFVS